MSPARDLTENSSAKQEDLVATLVVDITPITPEVTVETVAGLFRANAALTAIPVIEHGLPCGLVRRELFSNLYLSPYGRDLHGRKPVHQFMDREPLILADDIPLAKASQALTDSSRHELEQDFIITRAGLYRGMGRLRDLLKRITELQVLHARYANPLTLLPGNEPINEQINALLGAEATFVVCYCDLDNFKPYNDVYGYSQGDNVIRAVARLLREHAEPELDFVGHVGGDDFILICRSHDWRLRCEAILSRFADEVGNFYNPADHARGHIKALDRQGSPVTSPLLSLSIGVVAPDPKRCQSHHEVASLASDATS